MKNYNPNLVGAVSEKGPYRQENEDACWQPDHTSPVHLGALYIVADGVGGQEHGAIAARIVAAVLSEAFYRAREMGEAIPQALRFAVSQANQAVYDEADLSGLRMGATVVAAVVDQGELYTAHVGDSRAYLAAEDGLTPITRDDSFVQEQLDKGIITEAEAARHEFRNLVTQVLGNSLEIEIHVSEARPFTDDDLLLLCSDGVSGVLTLAQMRDILLENRAAEAAPALVQAAIDADSRDNVTAVVVEGGQRRPPLVPAASGKPSRDSRWRLVGLAALLILLLATIGLRWWNRHRLPVELDSADVTAPVEETATATPALLETAVPPTSLPTSTPDTIDTVLPTIAATETAVATPQPSATPPVIGCVAPNAIAYVWAKEDLAPDTCAGAVTNDSLNAGASVIILALTPEALPVKGICVDADFIEVQSQQDETIRGWVLNSDILRDNACP
jgi:protein phosphatase